MTETSVMAQEVPGNVRTSAATSCAWSAPGQQVVRATQIVCAAFPLAQRGKLSLAALEAFENICLMGRTEYYKVYHFGVFFGLPMVLIAATVSLHLSQNFIGVALLLLVVPGRILAFFWRDLLRGLKLLHEKRYEESIQYSERFLAELERRPWIQHMIWLGTSSYSINAKSLAYNNLGAAEFQLGRLDAARAHLHESILADNLNPMPFHNLALIALREGNEEEAGLMEGSAVARGLTFGTSDQMVLASQKRMASRQDV